MAEKKEGPQPVSRLIDEALRSCGLYERMQERGVLDAWPGIVGAEIAAHSRAVDLVDGVLVLEADHGAWRQELTMLAPRIIEKFNALFGADTVTDMQWRDRPHRSRKRNDAS